MKIRKQKQQQADAPVSGEPRPDEIARMITLDTENLLDETARWSDDYRRLSEAYAEAKSRLAAAELAQEHGRARVQLRIQQEHAAAGEKTTEYVLKMHTVADPEVAELGRAVIAAELVVNRYRGWIEAMSGKKGRIDSIVFGLHDAAVAPGTAKDAEVDEEDVARHMRALGRKARRERD